MRALVKIGVRQWNAVHRQHLERLRLVPNCSCKVRKCCDVAFTTRQNSCAPGLTLIMGEGPPSGKIAG